jgi:N-acetylmuramoyl-L-alanine amidase CwlA
LIAQLLKERGWGIERLKKHQDWSGKYCPHRILAEGRWQQFKKAVERELNTVSIAKKDDITGHWAEVSIKKAKEKSIINGYSDGQFKPDEPVTRAQLAVILDRLGLLK